MLQCMQQTHIVIRGKVQGVGFRYSTVKAATALNLVGWVRNLSDGSVEATAEGLETELEAFLNWCKIGPPSAQVVAVQILSKKTISELSFSVFEVVG